MKAYRTYFVRAIQARYPEDSAAIISRVDAHYRDIAQDTAFAATSGNPIDRRLDFCAYFLALIKTLDGQGEPFEEIRRICLAIVTEYVQPKNSLHAFTKQLLPKLINTWFGQLLIRVMQKKFSRNASPDGFIANIITDKQETYGFGYGIDILECGICKLFAKHKYHRYASILCEVDEITSALAGLQLVRTGTIANGAKKCDFRFMPIDQNGAKK